MPWSPRKKAAAFSIVLLLVSAGFVVTAAATTGDALLPLAAGRDYPYERSVTRHGVALGLLVASSDADGQVERAEGAQVTVSARRDDGSAGAPVAEKRTDERGQVVFQLRPGAYVVTVEWQGHQAHQSGVLRSSQRAAVLFDADGTAHWRVQPHDDLERRGDAYPLLVRVVDTSGGAREPVEGAVVEVRRAERGAADAPPLHSAATDAQGRAVLQLHTGPYVVTVTHDGESLSQTVRLEGPQRVHFAWGATDAPDGRNG